MCPHHQNLEKSTSTKPKSKRRLQVHIIIIHVCQSKREKNKKPTLEVRQYLVLSFPGKLSETRNFPSPRILTPSSAQYETKSPDLTTYIKITQKLLTPILLKYRSIIVLD